MKKKIEWKKTEHRTLIGMVDGYELLEIKPVIHRDYSYIMVDKRDGWQYYDSNPENLKKNAKHII